jgi:hypothetical protein
MALRVKLYVCAPVAASTEVVTAAGRTGVEEGAVVRDAVLDRDGGLAGAELDEGCEGGADVVDVSGVEGDGDWVDVTDVLGEPSGWDDGGAVDEATEDEDVDVEGVGDVVEHAGTAFVSWTSNRCL